MIYFLLLTLGSFILPFLFGLGVKLGYLFDFSPVSQGRLLLLWTFHLALLLLNPIGFGLLCFLFHSFLCIFWILLLISSVISWLFRSVLFSLHMFVFLIFFSCSVHFSSSVVSKPLWPHESQYARPSCPSPTLRVHSNSCPWSRWCHPAISSPVVPFFSCPQSLPASESFPMSQLFAWGGQSTGVLALASFLPKSTQGWAPSEWTGWISLQSKGLSRVFSNTTVPKHQFFGAQLSLWSSSHIHTRPLEKHITAGLSLFP